MKQELLRIIKMPFYWLIISAGVIIRAVLAYLDRLYRPEQYWSLCADFWIIIGALTMVVLILVCLIRLFTIDYECGAEKIISSTAFGRKIIFWQRLSAITVGAAFGVFMLTFANILIALIVGQRIEMGSTWIFDFLKASWVALCGSVALSLVSGAVSDISKSQPATMCICGTPFIISLFINSSMVKPFELFWFLRYGFFSELMRGRALESLPGFWAAWYGMMMIAAVVFAIHKRKERKEI